MELQTSHLFCQFDRAFLKLVFHLVILPPQFIFWKRGGVLAVNPQT